MGKHLVSGTVGLRKQTDLQKVKERGVYCEVVAVCGGEFVKTAWALIEKGFDVRHKLAAQESANGALVWTG